MDYDRDKVDEMVLALLFLNMFGDEYGVRAWKGFDWDSLGRLYEQGYIGSPRSKAKSVVVTEEGQMHSERLFRKHFGLLASQGE